MEQIIDVKDLKVGDKFRLTLEQNVYNRVNGWPDSGYAKVTKIDGNRICGINPSNGYETYLIPTNSGYKKCTILKDYDIKAVAKLLNIELQKEVVQTIKLDKTEEELLKEIKEKL